MSLIRPSTEIKKELLTLKQAELTAICLRLVRFKKENKELMSYLLFKADDQDNFIQEYKQEMDVQFSKANVRSYLVVKTLRNIATQMNNHIRYAGSETVKIELLLHFCNNYISYVDYQTHYKPLRSVFSRHVEKAKATIQKLHEDLQYDYGNLYQEMLANASQKINWFEKNSFRL